MQPTNISLIKTYDSSLIFGLEDIQKQLSEILQIVTQDQYTKVIPKQSSIGAHVRHIIEFMQALDTSTSLINYDDRKRNHEIETSNQTAKMVLDKAVVKITERLKENETDQTIQMIEKLSSDHHSFPVPTTLAREVAYVIQHGIHHIFIIKTLAQIQGIQLNDKIGMAPATIEYQQKQCAH